MMRKRLQKTKVLLSIFIIIVLCFSGCAKSEDESSIWKEKAHLEGDETEEILYEKALLEDILVVYTVSTRVTKVKESFEKTYPGLCVEIRDLRSPELIKAVKSCYLDGKSECDIVICNGNSGDFKNELVDAGYVVPYMPDDIAGKMKEGHVGEIVSFLDEAEMLFYNTDKYEECPIQNIWELTEPRYQGKIYLPSPLRSFSTFAFCGMTASYQEELAVAYEAYFGEHYDDKWGSPDEFLWRGIARNAVFTNSSDEVCEQLGNGAKEADFGIMVSSKYRYKEIGYTIEPVYELVPFSGCVTNYALMMAAGSRNVNAAKLFIRYLLGEEDGKGDGYQPFCTLGTWSARKDVSDGNPVRIEDTDLLQTDAEDLNRNRKRVEEFWSELLAK